jgi:hypothetical protein
MYTGTSLQEPVSDKVAVKGNAWMKAHLCRIPFCGDPINWRRPPSTWVAREFDEDHAAALRKSYLKKGVLSTQAKPILVSHAYSMPPEHFTPEVVTAIENSMKFAFVGDHRRDALQSLQREFPMAQQYKEVDYLLVFCDQTEESLSMLRLFGRHDNTIAGIQKQTPFNEMMMNCRRDYVQACHIQESKRLGRKVDLTNEQLDQLKLETTNLRFLKNNWMFAYGIKIGVAGHICSFIASSCGFWSRLLKILNKDVIEPKKLKAVRSPGHIIRLNGLPEQCKLDCLDKVIDGSINMRGMAELAQSMKAEIRARKALIKMVDPAGQCKGLWRIARSKHPSICTDNFIRKWGMAFATSPKAVPPDFVNEVKSMIERLKAGKRADEVIVYLRFC